jgi:hypothetical protein
MSVTWRTDKRQILSPHIECDYGGQGQNGLALLALWAHCVRLSPLRGSVELPTRGFSERQVIDSVLIYQRVSGASVA